MTNTNKTIVFTLLASLVWAILFIASAKIFKGNPAKEWIQAVLYGFGVFLMFLPVTMRSRSRCC
jgi:VIT1/CCC1 family predicted Fe2+/Mn2+ transporter